MPPGLTIVRMPMARPRSAPGPLPADRPSTSHADATAPPLSNAGRGCLAYGTTTPYKLHPRSRSTPDPPDHVTADARRPPCTVPKDLRGCATVVGPGASGGVEIRVRE